MLQGDGVRSRQLVHLLHALVLQVEGVGEVVLHASTHASVRESTDLRCLAFTTGLLVEWLHREGLGATVQTGREEFDKL